MRIVICLAVLLVVMPAGAVELVDNGDGTLTDPVTDLMWVEEVKLLFLTYSNALFLLDIRNLNDQYNDWRLPTYSEIRRIWKNIKPAFGTESYWTSDIGCLIVFPDHYDYTLCDEAYLLPVRQGTIPEPKIYTQSDLNAAILTEKKRWDADGDNRIGLAEAIRALQIMADFH